MATPTHKRCPFCGHAGEVQPHYRMRETGNHQEWTIACPVCGCRIGKSYEKKTDAWREWDRRVGMSDKTKELSPDAIAQLALKALAVRAFVAARKLGAQSLADELLAEWTKMVSVNGFSVKEAKERLEPLVERVKSMGGKA